MNDVFYPQKIIVEDVPVKDGLFNDRGRLCDRGAPGTAAGITPELVDRQGAASG